MQFRLLFLIGIFCQLTITFMSQAQTLDVDENIEQHTAPKITIKVVTEDSYPLQYMKDNKIVGPTTELLIDVLNEAHIDFEIEMLPWARAYAIASQQENVLIYSIAKTPLREHQFQWVGVIMELEYYLYGKDSSNINENTPFETLKSQRIATVRDSAIHQFFVAENFKYLTDVSHPKQSFEMLHRDRIDLFPANRTSFQLSCLKLRQRCDNLKPLYRLPMESIKLFFAFSPQTDAAIVERVKQAYVTIDNQRKNDVASQAQINGSIF